MASETDPDTPRAAAAGAPHAPGTDPPGAPAERGGWLADAERLDVALYAAVARTPTPALDRAMAKLSHAADYSRISLAAAALLATAGGPRGRRAAVHGLAAIAVTSTVVNQGMKRLGRRRPDRARLHVPEARHVPMPDSTSFPSGHAAAAFAFATGVGHVLPGAAVPLRGLAAAVAWSRIHTGVHYPGDVAVGALTGTVLAQLTAQLLERRF
ncbi:phosphatase PAP2 family protein [Conexibacter sp. JD483]|uniref:phosphatase PAP2 family protein n=1 Tax=unclassified Conexibacter TaxID=2627773 RepID=UPI002725A876|nr:MULTISPECIES: phosphatase PAP2 family protein [unclassified Conexibacter]MDO8185618.1 phosphatase PAP2 family protein [Conexibacter sp. CPCC 205706]MDO8198791.1 phosphatase PAP2 family protein [Conexibacter sp. CPCC 205762]MDR9367859.1 phosphatase PAP2 family protein [Conexibacter sp. JD483]